MSCSSNEQGVVPIPFFCLGVHEDNDVLALAVIYGPLLRIFSATEADVDLVCCRLLVERCGIYPHLSVSIIS
jgi:hypothetical protein